MFRLIATMRRGSATGVPAAWGRYATIEAARLATAILLHDDRILRVMIVRNEIPPAFVEWAERRISKFRIAAESTAAILSRGGTRRLARIDASREGDQERHGYQTAPRSD